jgi:predicted aminopeptidase
MSAVWLAWMLGLAAGLAGCASTTNHWLSAPAYYWQSVRGHLGVVQAARPVAEVLADAATSPRLREQLMLAQDVRQFAIAQLGLPDTPSYTRYASLADRFVVWNVVAAPADSLRLRRWCFVVAGCVGYRGYYAQADAQAFAQHLRQHEPHLEVAVYGVVAYSTLGYTDWLGGDPLLSSFIGYPAGELARLIIHELAHQRLYVAGDMAFNESFATAVEKLGGAQWLAQRGTLQQRLEYERFAARREAFRALTRHTRDALRRLYQDHAAARARQPASSTQATASAETTALAATKKIVMDDFHSRYAQFRQDWATPQGPFSGYDMWVAQINNALLGAQAAYDDAVPSFMALFEREGGHWGRFYDAATALSRLSHDERWAALDALHPVQRAPKLAD